MSSYISKKNQRNEIAQRGKFYRLPQELQIYIYSFDSTYRDLYNNCVCNLNKDYSRHRINDRIQAEINVYKIYDHHYDPIRMITKIYSFSEYMLERIRLFGDQIDDNDLLSYSLQNIESPYKVKYNEDRNIYLSYSENWTYNAGDENYDEYDDYEDEYEDDYYDY